MKFRNWPIDWCVLAPLFVVLTVMRLPPQCLPIHDSLQVFQAFHYFYSSLIFDNTCPQWVPYGAYGMPFDFWACICLTPASYLAAALGYLLGVQDALLVFKLSMAVEELAFVVGLYALCRLIFRRREAVLFVCIGALLGLNWLFQLWWNFRLFYMVPAGLAWLVLFFQRSQPHYVWLSGITFITALIGNLPYYAPLYLFVVVVFAAMMQVQAPVDWRVLFSRSMKNLVTLSAFLVLSGCYVFSVRYCMGPLSTATGRDPQSGGVGLGIFLTHGGNPDVFNLFRQMLNGWPIISDWSAYPDLSVYIGLLPWFMLIWAAFRVRVPVFLAMAGTTVVLLWLAAGGLVAATIYYFPSMFWFRHIALVYSLCKILVLICAGFGFEDFLEQARPGHLLLLAASSLFLVDSLVHHRAMIAVKNLLGSENLAGAVNWTIERGDDLHFDSVIVLRALVYALAACAVILAGQRVQVNGSERIRSPLLPLAFLLAFAFDMISFVSMSQLVIADVPGALADSLQSTRAAPLEFIERREDQPPAGRSRQAAQLTEFLRYQALPNFCSGLNQMSYAFIRQDPCVIEIEQRDRPAYFSPFHLKSVAPILDLTLDQARADYLCGCGQQKLRLFADAGQAVGRDEFLKMIHEETTGGLALIEAAGNLGTGALAKRTSAGSVRVLHFSANRVTLEVEWNGSESAWLVYADAYHPDWQATIDGRMIEIDRGLLGFKAAAVPPGRSVLEFAFRPIQWLHPVYVTAALGIAAWLALGIMFLSFGDRHTPASPSSEEPR